MLTFLLLSAQGEGTAVVTDAATPMPISATDAASAPAAEVEAVTVQPTTEPVEEPSQPWTGFLLPVLMVAFVWFVMIRPENKRRKEMNKFREGIKKGDKVVTAGGIHGIVKEVKDATLNLEIDNNVHITIDKSMVVAQPTEAPAKK